MKTSILHRLGLLTIATAILMSQPAFSSDGELGLYSSLLPNPDTGRMAFSIRGDFGSFDDIAGTFLDADNDMMADGFVIDTLILGVPQGSQTHGFAGVDSAGVTFLAFPIVTANNFNLTFASFLPGVPAAALPLVPMTEQGTIVVTRTNGDPILSIPLLIDPELLSDSLFGNGFETANPPPAPVR